ncbi:response regulator transcription factor [Enterococcus sp. DIV0876]|uniref:response regulator transcription factor n=1 Tax=Enterococcus sp. DIV0876 TaxID=2774633 RepID=UPI003D300D90
MKILIIDDDLELCELLKKSIESIGFFAEYELNGKNGIAKLQNDDDFHLVILDVMMPKIGGFTILKELRKLSNVPVMMLTAKNDSLSKVNGLEIGADDYMTKPFEMSEFLARVGSLIRRYTDLNEQKSSSIAKFSFGDLSIDMQSREVEISNKLIELTVKEFDILALLIKNKGTILTKQQIYENVWQDVYAYDDDNIMSVFSRLRKKIEENPRNPKYIQTVRGIGYRFIANRNR